MLNPILNFLGRVQARTVAFLLVVAAVMLGQTGAFATDDLFTSITTEVTTDAGKVVAFSIVAIGVTIAFYLWGLGRKSIGKAK